jgi:hypothetical protein
MKGYSKINPEQVIDLKPGFQIRWNIESDQTDDNETHYKYDCNINYIPKILTKKEIMLSIIREKYDENDEVALSFNREGDKVKIIEHEEYVNMSRSVAESIC